MVKSDIAVGKVVRLLSGGPLMTVLPAEEAALRYLGPDHWRCAWFDERGNNHAVYFPGASLAVVNEAKAGDGGP